MPAYTVTYTDGKDLLRLAGVTNPRDPNLPALVRSTFSLPHTAAVLSVLSPRPTLPGERPTARFPMPPRR